MKNWALVIRYYGDEKVTGKNAIRWKILWQLTQQRFSAALATRKYLFAQ